MTISEKLSNNAPLFALLLGIIASIWISLAAYDLEVDSRKAAYNHMLDQHVATFSQKLSASMSAIDSIIGLFLASNKVDRDEFGIFASNIMKNTPGIQALEWIPRVPHRERLKHEELARQQGYENFSFTERGSDNVLIRAGAREEYFPVYFIEPVRGNFAALGYDLASNKIRKAALEKSRDIGQAVVTGRISLLQAGDAGYGFLIMKPIYKKNRDIQSIQDRREQLAGYSLGVFKVNDLMASRYSGFEGGTDLKKYLFDESAADESQLLYPKQDGIRQYSDLNAKACVKTNIPISTRDWAYVICHTESQYNIFTSGRSSLIFVGGTILSMLLFIYLQASTRQRQAERDRLRIANELRIFLDTANAPIVGVDMNGLVNEWNQSTERITGYTKAEAMGSDFVNQFIPEDFKETVQKVLSETLKGRHVEDFEFPLRSKKGKRIDLLMNSTARRNIEGNIIGAIGFGQDITLRKEAEAQVVQASKLATLGEMATSVAHELNQPLNVIRMAAGNVVRKMKKGEVDKDYLIDKMVRISGQTERAASIIDHMRMFGRKIAEDPILLSPNDLVNGALELMGEQLRLSDIEVKVNLPYDAPNILAHRVQVEQVLLNLLANARDAILSNDMSENKRIEISVTQADASTVSIEVKDTGIGIPENAMEHIFEPFFTTKDIGSGTGLGLSVSYGIVRDMGGSITATNHDDGACLTITLPVAS